ncbi:MAG: 2-hydroxyacid dehydrogenase [Pseudomonadota bacterium]|nr:2-hydroxyacid dehydrogenase [Pseudomonadota bacterium]MEC7360997.1 2-hydroxyacid dehydrogenase [Pseudomonadota bacterium]MEC7437321.1 2-hydroxyacid dehydrogenase [Pseudomonadota bacterium]MEC7485058.1 2-hydroxyacid dehydrogenase [Pseudomonadota bacterium]MEC7494800.1 2-hydroxyacid dehydrogenase [Pseudomonadota bacterium]
MSGLLVIGAITGEMRDRLTGSLEIHDADRIDDMTAFLAQDGAALHYALTDGHYGVPRDWMDAMPNLKLISNYGVGYDAIDVDLSVSRRILVTHTPEVLNDEVATTALMLMLAGFRNLLASDAHVRSGGWSRTGHMALSRSADNRRVGILGLGRIGLALAKKLEPFHAEISYHNRNPRDVPYRHFADLTEMASESEVLFVVTPGGADTRSLVSREVIEALGPEGMLVNVSRGSVVEEEALVAALEDGRLGAAGLDVFEDEPNVPEALFSMKNVVLTPHIGSATVETRRAMGNLVIDNLLQHLSDGRVLSPVPECREFATVAAAFSG